MAVITISRQFGAGGRSLGEMIATELDYKFVDDLVIQELAKKAKVTTDDIKDMERTSGSVLSKIISSMLSRNYMERIVGEGKGYINEVIYVELIKDVLTNFARQGNVVLLGRGGQYILKDFKDAFHILLVADMERRIKFMQQFYSMTDAQAEKAVKQGNERRRNLYKKLGYTDYNSPNLYHIVLNMSRLSMDHALETIVALVKKSEKSEK
jgi:cytidylate kinase